MGSKAPEEAGFRLIGAHTDSPNLRIKPNPEFHKAGYGQLRIEVYGGALWNTWLDRDLSIAGKVFFRGPNGLESALLLIDHPILRIPNLAIHLNRNVNREGLVLNAQQHLNPIWKITGQEGLGFRALLRESLRRSGGKKIEGPEDICAWDLSLFDTTPSSRWGGSTGSLSLHQDSITSPAATRHSLHFYHVAEDSCEQSVGFVFYDHEECGSQSTSGAHSEFLESTLRRLCDTIPQKSSNNFESYRRALGKSWLISADMAHAVHPNYTERHDAQHIPTLGSGPVIKHNGNQAYATTAENAAWFAELCRKEGITPQHFVTRNDMGCGSTIGPISAARVGIRTIDVGNPMLGMHSCRETASAEDVEPMIRVFSAFYGAAL